MKHVLNCVIMPGFCRLHHATILKPRDLSRVQFFNALLVSQLITFYSSAFPSSQYAIGDVLMPPSA